MRQATAATRPPTASGGEATGHGRMHIETGLLGSPSFRQFGRTASGISTGGLPQRTGRRAAKKHWKIAVIAVRCCLLLKTLTTVRPRLTEDEKQKIALAYEESVANLSSPSAILDLILSLGLSLTEAELADIMGFVGYDPRSGRSIMLRQLLKIAQVLKNRYENSITSEAFDAYAALRERSRAEAPEEAQDGIVSLDFTGVPLTTLARYMASFHLQPDAALRELDATVDRIDYAWFEDHLGTADPLSHPLAKRMGAKTPPFFIPAAMRQKFRHIVRTHSLRTMSMLQSQASLSFPRGDTSGGHGTSHLLRAANDRRTPRSGPAKFSPSWNLASVQSTQRTPQSAQSLQVPQFGEEVPSFGMSVSVSGGTAALSTRDSSIRRLGGSRHQRSEKMNATISSTDAFARYIQHRKNSRDQREGKSAADALRELVASMSEKLKTMDFPSCPAFEAPHSTDRIHALDVVTRYAFPGEHQPGGRASWRTADVVSRIDALATGSPHPQQHSRNIHYSHGDKALPHYDGLDCLNGSDGSPTAKRALTRSAPPKPPGRSASALVPYQERTAAETLSRLSTPKLRRQADPPPPTKSIFRPETAPSWAGGEAGCRLRRRFVQGLPRKSVDELAQRPPYLLKADEKVAIVAARVAEAPPLAPLSRNTQIIAANALDLLERRRTQAQALPSLTASQPRPMRPASALQP